MGMPFQEETGVLVGSDAAVVVGVADCCVAVGVEDGAGVSVGSGVEVAVGLDVTVALGKGVKDGRLVAAGVGAGAIALQAVTAATEQTVITTFTE